MEGPEKFCCVESLMKILPYTFGYHTLRIILIRTLYSFLFQRKRLKSSLSSLCLAVKQAKLRQKKWIY